jgi:pimeloyl-ACP methyl ester carboxylesterase
MMHFDHFSGAHLEVDGAQIYFETTGDKNNPNLLVLHGGFGTLEDFNGVMTGLTKKYFVIGIDSRGQGKSTTGSKKLSYQQIQNDIERILEHLSIDTLSIIGFSDGGIAAYRLACLSSLKIEKLVTIGSRWHPKNVETARDLLSKVTGESWRNKFPNTFETYQKLNPEPDFDRLAQSLVSMGLDSGSSGYPSDAVKNISCPLLIVRGDDDHLISREIVFELAGIVKNSRLLNIPFAGHAAFEDQKEIFLLCLNEFLNS